MFLNSMEKRRLIDTAVPTLLAEDDAQVVPDLPVQVSPNLTVQVSPDLPAPEPPGQHDYVSLDQQLSTSHSSCTSKPALQEHQGSL